MNWSQPRFEEVRTKLSTFLVKSAGFREGEVRFVPCSGLIGENLTQKPKADTLCSWYDGPTLLEAIGEFCSTKLNYLVS